MRVLSAFLYTILNILTFVACQTQDRETEVLLLSTNDVQYRGTTENGVTFSATIVLDNSDVIIESGFVYDLNRKPIIQSGKILYVDGLVSNAFTAGVEEVLRPDTLYYVRSFVKTDQYFLYGNEVSFFSNGTKPPVLNSIEPQLAFWSDTIKIEGDNFDDAGIENRVFFDDFESKNVWGSEDTIYAVVPAELNSKSCEVKVELFGKISENSKAFEIYSPIVNSINKTEGEFPDTVTILGDNFNPDYLKIILNEDSCDIISVSKNTIAFKVPFIGDQGEYSIKIEQAKETVVAYDNFNYIEQIIYGFPTEGVYYGEPVVLKAKNVDFRKIKLMFVVDNDSYLWDSNIRNYNDSISFTLQNSYKKLQKTNGFGLREQDYWYLKNDFYSGDFTVKDPEVALLEKETVVNGTLKFKTRGLGEDRKFYVEGPINYSGEFNIYNDTWQIDFDPLPGTYQFYYEDEILGKKYIGDFIIKELSINKLPEDSYSRDYNTKIILDGLNLPDRLLRDDSYYSVKHVLSGKTITFSNDSYPYTISFNPRELIGRGKYELSLFIRGQEVSNVIEFNFEDDFVFNKKIDVVDLNHQNHNVILYCNGKLFYKESSTKNYLIDIENNTYSSVPYLGVSLKALTFFNGYIYWLTPYGEVYMLSDQNEWIQVSLINEESLIDILFVDGNSLWVILKNGDIYKNEQSDFVFYKTIQEYSYYKSAYLYDNKLYCIRREKIYIYDFGTLNLLEEVSGYYYDYYGWEHDLKVKNALFLYDNDFVTFNLDTKEFSKPQFRYLPGSWDVGFFADENDELFLLYDNYIYQYSPN